MSSPVLLLALFCCMLATTLCCEPGEYQNGCKIYANTCTCGYGCRSEYIYKTRRACTNTLRANQASTAPPAYPERTIRSSPPVYQQRSRPAQSSYSDRSRPVQPAYSEHSRSVQPAYSEHSRPVQPAYSERSGPVQPAYSEHSRPVQPAYSEHSRPVQPAYSERSGPVQPEYSDRSRQTQHEYSERLGSIQPYSDRSRQLPLPTLPERSSNICSRKPCLRGTCLQTYMEPGFTCKCESTGYYGQRCEKACPTSPIPGMVFPHECIVI